MTWNFIMSNRTNTSYSIPTSTPEQRRYHRAVSLSREQVDGEFDKIAAQLQAEGLNSGRANETLRERRDQNIDRSDLERIFNPQPTKEEVAKMMEEISAYLAQEGMLLDTYRDYEVRAK